MSVPRSVAEVLSEHVTLEVEGIDRMYLNVYIPHLQREVGVASFFRFHRGHQFASSALMDPISKAFVAEMEAFAQQEQIPVVQFRKGQRKDDITAEHLKEFTKEEGVLFIGKAQEKTPVFRTERRRNEKTGGTYPWLIRSTAMVNHFYVYCVDRDFGPFFLKFSPYFPTMPKLCLNGHEYAKRQLTNKGIGFESLDNGVLSCDDPKRLQAICDGLSAEKIDALLRKWLRKLPHPFTAADRKAGYRYQVSILQAEFSLTQVLDRPVTGRVFFEEVIRENLDIGRPSQVQLIFDRRVTKRTPGRFRTRVITDGVIPSLHIDYKNTRIKQYHKEGRALRTETTINNTRDFGIGKLLKNLPALRQIGFRANRRLLDVQKISHDCAIGEDAFHQVVRPIEVDGQRASALRFGDVRVQALFAVLAVFSLQLRGFTNQEMRLLLAQMLGLDPATQPPLSTDTRRAEDRPVLFPNLFALASSCSGRHHASGSAQQVT
ncbi:MAG: hypothetical protein H7039_19350, partial [Bryobacteraceae bacterium]|nr:hypothetical protein [Bryobacteraceae bacterium]